MSFLNGPETSGTLLACDLSTIDATDSPAAIPASATHVATRVHGDWRAATSAATIAVMPITTCPQPDTAVNVAALSIMPRM